VAATGDDQCVDADVAVSGRVGDEARRRGLPATKSSADSDRPNSGSAVWDEFCGDRITKESRTGWEALCSQTYILQISRGFRKKTA
jgi:hypothetical protein